MIVKSPGGSVFPYYYKGGQIHCLKYGSKYKDTAQLFEIMAREEEFIISTGKKLKIWVDFYKTSLTSIVLEHFITNIGNISEYVDRMSIVGLSRFNQWRLRRGLKNSGIKFKISFFEDPEDAKTWLIGDSASIT